MDHSLIKWKRPWELRSHIINARALGEKQGQWQWCAYRNAMVVEERTKRKDTAQHTKEETKAMENFLRVRYGMTNTEVSLILGQYGAATIEMLRQGIHEETLANALQTKA